VLSRYARVYQWAERVPASVAAKLAGVRADSSIFYYLDGKSIHNVNKLFTIEVYYSVSQIVDGGGVRAYLSTNKTSRRGHVHDISW